jgi:ABC-type polysaccharide/polyol phosphate transport system ATPase subunit
MNSDIAISVNNLSKKYRLYESPQHRLKEALHPFRKKYHRDFWALENVSLEISKGEVVGIIGKNGAGKSTLLKIITGVLMPTSGDVVVNGKISALLELGTGFNPELTGIKNVYFSGMVMGYTKEEMDAKMDDILSFADIGDFVYQPIKTYSSGMLVRLGFATAINVDPDILVVDEALAVGDIRFQQKCFRKLNEFREMEKTILFVTHAMQIVKNYCSTAIWIRDGKVYQTGGPEQVIKDYTSYMFYDMVSTPKAGQDERSAAKERTAGNIIWDSVEKCSSFGEGGAEIKKVALYKKKPFEKAVVLKGGEEVVFMVDIEAKEDIAAPIAGFVVSDELGNRIMGTNTYVLGRHMKTLRKGEALTVDFEFSFPKIKNGSYTFSPAIAEGTQGDHIQHHWVHEASVVHMVNEDAAAKLGWYIILDDMKVRLNGLES